MKARYLVHWLLGLLAFPSALALVFMLLWNSVATSVFGVGAISFWQAWGLLLMLQIALLSCITVFVWIHHVTSSHSHANQWHSMNKEQKAEFVRQFKKMRERRK